MSLCSSLASFSHCFKRLEERNFQVVSVLDKSERRKTLTYVAPGLFLNLTWEK